MKARTHCKKCNVKLDVSNSVYYNRALASFCHECYNLRKKIYYAKGKNLGRIREWNLKSKYGITSEEYERLKNLQWNGCAICRMPFDKLHVDHNHETGEVRGLLCHKCNIILGYVENNEDLVVDAMEYLKRTTNKKEVA